MTTANTKKPKYKPAHERDIDGSVHLGVHNKSNPFAPPDRYLEFGDVSKKIETPIDRRTTIFVNPRHDVERAKAFYQALAARFTLPETETIND